MTKSKIIITFIFISSIWMQGCGVANYFGVCRNLDRMGYTMDFLERETSSYYGQKCRQVRKAMTDAGQNCVNSELFCQQHPEHCEGINREQALQECGLTDCSQCGECEDGEQCQPE